MNNKEIILRETQVIKILQEHIAECDADALADLLAHIFGGECYADFAIVDGFEEHAESCYFFEPNENYGGGLDSTI